MADTISHVWQTVEQAAVTLNCSTRTIARRIANGSMESRVDENGRRLVLVQTVTPASDRPESANPTAPIEQTSPATAIATPVQQSDALVLPEKAAGVLAVLQSTIDAAREDAKVARNGARWAWAGIGVLALTLVVSTIYLNQTATKAQTKATILEQQVVETKAELGQTRNDLLAAHAARAVAEQERSIAITRVSEIEAKLAEVTSKAASETTTVAIADTTEASATEDAAPATQPSVDPKLALPLKSFVNSFLNDE